MKATLFLNVLLGSALFSGLFFVRPVASQVNCAEPCPTSAPVLVQPQPQQVNCVEARIPCPAPTPTVVQPQPCRTEVCPPPVAPVVTCPDTEPCMPAEGHLVVEEYPGRFVCEDGYMPTTMFYAPEGDLPVIRWVSHYFAESGYSPEVRCREVSARFQRYYEDGTLNYITTGIVNRLPVVCVSSELGGPCRGVLFTLRPQEDASQVVQQLFDISYANAGPLYESGSRIYLDMNEYLAQLRAQQNP